MHQAPVPATPSNGALLVWGRATRSLATAALVVSAFLPARAACAGPTKVPDAPYPEEFRSRVRKSIQKGVEYLRTSQIKAHDSSDDSALLKGLADEVAFQEAAAVTWVLRRAGVAADDRAFSQAAKVLAARAPKTPEEASLLLLGLCVEALPSGDPFAMQDPAQGKPASRSFSKSDRALADRAVKFLLDEQIKSSETASLGPEFDETGGWDPCLDADTRFKTAFVDQTYLAVIGLEAAARAGISVPSAAYANAMRLLLRRQQAKGSAVTLKVNEVRGADRFEWTESAHARGFDTVGLEGQSSGYDTVAGAVALVVCQDALQKDKAFTKELRQKSHAAIRDAFAWVQQNYDITKNPIVGKRKSAKEADIGGDLYHHHWLQGLARLAIHARMRLVNGHDWFQEGAEHLMKTQSDDGMWHPIWWDNCYALLFLMRASLTSLSPVVTVTDR